MHGKMQQCCTGTRVGRPGALCWWGLVIFLGLSSLAQAGAEAPVSLEQIAQEPQPYLGREIVVEGVLEARGRSLPPQFRLRSTSGATLAVSPWAPLEIYHPRQGKAGVKSMAEFVGKRLRLTGQLTQEHGSPILKVTAAQVL
jgi:hypothetical protein